MLSFPLYLLHQPHPFPCTRTRAPITHMGPRATHDGLRLGLRDGNVAGLQWGRLWGRGQRGFLVKSNTGNKEKQNWVPFSEHRSDGGGVSEPRVHSKRACRHSTGTHLGVGRYHISSTGSKVGAVFRGTRRHTRDPLGLSPVPGCGCAVPVGGWWEGQVAAPGKFWAAQGEKDWGDCQGGDATRFRQRGKGRWRENRALPAPLE